MVAASCCRRVVWISTAARCWTTPRRSAAASPSLQTSVPPRSTIVYSRAISRSVKTAMAEASTLRPAVGEPIRPRSRAASSKAMPPSGVVVASRCTVTRPSPLMPAWSPATSPPPGPAVASSVRGARSASRVRRSAATPPTSSPAATAILVATASSTSATRIRTAPSTATISARTIRTRPSPGSAAAVCPRVWTPTATGCSIASILARIGRTSAPRTGRRSRWWWVSRSRPRSRWSPMAARWRSPPVRSR